MRVSAASAKQHRLRAKQAGAPPALRPASATGSNHDAAVLRFSSPAPFAIAAAARAAAASTAATSWQGQASQGGLAGGGQDSAGTPRTQPGPELMEADEGVRAAMSAGQAMDWVASSGAGTASEAQVSQRAAGKAKSKDVGGQGWINPAWVGQQLIAAVAAAAGSPTQGSAAAAVQAAGGMMRMAVEGGGHLNWYAEAGAGGLLLKERAGGTSSSGDGSSCPPRTAESAGPGKQQHQQQQQSKAKGQLQVTMAPSCFDEEEYELYKR